MNDENEIERRVRARLQATVGSLKKDDPAYMAKVREACTDALKEEMKASHVPASMVDFIVKLVEAGMNKTDDAKPNAPA